MKKKAIIGITVTMLILLCAYLGISGYMASSMTEQDRMLVTDDPSSLGLSYDEVSFSSRKDNLTLKGWYIHSGEEQPAIIMVHGAEGNRSSGVAGVLELASDLGDAGYNVLMFDLRGHGESEEAHLSGGYYERRDVLGAVDYLESRGVRNIGVLGFSLGAAVSILAAAEEPRISAVVSDSCFADLTEIVDKEATRKSELLGLFTQGYVFMLKLMYGVDLNAVRPIDAVRKIAPRPLLFIHGEADDYVPPAHVNRLCEASDNLSNQVWIVTHAEHVKCYETAPLEYVERVTAFFEQELCVDE